MPVEYEWDEVKREANLARHGLDFAQAVHFLSTGSIFDRITGIKLDTLSLG